MKHRSTSNRALRAILALVGLGIILLGLNVGLGGVRTLGWQGATDFIAVTNLPAYQTQDNHIRFLGGFWLGAGMVVFLGAFLLQRLRLVLLAVIGMVFVGGLARLSALDSGVLASASIAPSLAAELVGFPLLGLWISRVTAAADEA